MLASCSLLVTAFEPYGNFVLNASQQVLEHLRPSLPIGVVALLLPCDRQRAWSSLAAALDAYQPSLLLSLGQASGRAVVCLERLARNCLDFPIPDNGGQQPRQELIELQGPDILTSDLPLELWSAKLREQGLPCELSENAGTYLCNQVFYQSLYCAAQGRGLRVTFVHLPLLPEQVASDAGAPALELPVQCQVVTALIEEAMSNVLPIARTCPLSRR